MPLQRASVAYAFKGFGGRIVHSVIEMPCSPTLDREDGNALTLIFTVFKMISKNM